MAGGSYDLGYLAHVAQIVEGPEVDHLFEPDGPEGGVFAPPHPRTGREKAEPGDGSSSRFEKALKLLAPGSSGIGTSSVLSRGVIGLEKGVSLLHDSPRLASEGALHVHQVPQDL